MSEVRLDHLTKIFSGGTTAVDDFSLTVRDGEFWASRCVCGMSRRHRRRPSTASATPSTLDLPVAVDESAAAQLWTAKVSQFADLAIGRPVLLSVDLTEAYFFDPETGLAVQGAPTATPEASDGPAVTSSDPVASVRS